MFFIFQREKYVLVCSRVRFAECCFVGSLLVVQTSHWSDQTTRFLRVALCVPMEPVAVAYDQSQAENGTELELRPNFAADPRHEMEPPKPPAPASWLQWAFRLGLVRIYHRA